MRIGLVSYHQRRPSNEGDIRRDFQLLRQCAVTLVQEGFQVLWLSSTETAQALAREVNLVCTGEEDLPATCRYVIPCQSYRFNGVRLFCVHESLWQRPDLRTRLFTFLSLLHRELPYALLHAWGTLSAVYTTVYTARFLGLPAVVTYSRPGLCHEPQQTFAWRWVARQTARLLVTNPEDSERLLEATEVVPGYIDVIDPALSTAGTLLTTLYQHVLPP